MEIWEEKYESEKYGLESDASFLMFNRILGETNRSYPAIATKIVYEELQKEKEEFELKNPNEDYQPPSEKQRQNRIYQKTHTIRDYSKKWNYQERFKAYDLYISVKHREQKEKMVLDWEKEQLKIALSRPFIHHETLMQVHASTQEDMPISKRAYSEETNERAYYNSLQAVYSILHSGVQVVESSQTQEINLKKEEKIISNTIFDAVDKVLGLSEESKTKKESKTIKKEPNKIIKPNGD